MTTLVVALFSVLYFCLLNTGYVPNNVYAGIAGILLTVSIVVTALEDSKALHLEE